MEARHGPLLGRRHYVRVLELLAEHPRLRVQQVLEHSQGFEGLDAEVIAQRTRQLALREQLALCEQLEQVTGKFKRSRFERSHPRGLARAGAATDSGPL
jgi:hypothetical protein